MPSQFDVLVPYTMRRAVLANGEGGPLAFARGEVAGVETELVGDRAHLDLRSGGGTTAALHLQDWTAEARGEAPPPAPGTEAWRFTVDVGAQSFAGEVDKVKQGGSLLGEATRYWKLAGSGHAWFWGNGPAPERGSRARTFHLWRDQPTGDPLVVVTVTAVEERNVESAVSAVGQAVRSSVATDADEQVAVLLSVGGFQGELVGRNERIGKAAKWLAGTALDEVTGPPYIR